eukprot:Skav214262  [mRNA]  locus=scaffold2045:541969:542169:+ [translate_table: standard]
MAAVVANGTQTPQLPMWAAVAFGTCRTAFAMLASVALLALLLGHAMGTWITEAAKPAQLAMRTTIA